MINQLIAEKLNEKFPGSIVELEETPTDYITIIPENWVEIAEYLKNDTDLLFDSLQCITGVDNGPEAQLEARYNLHSMKHFHKIEIRIAVDRENPQIPSIEQIWRVGDWLEREVYDMYGIVFEGHRDLRRILCADDWEGWPLRKDYVVQETYHGITVPKNKEGWE